MKRKQTALTFVLKGLVPYSRENLLLAYKPNRFFNELGKVSGYSEKTLRNSLYRAEQAGLVNRRHQAPVLSPTGWAEVQPFIATKLRTGGRLMVIFDVPEESAALRRQFRRTLQHLDFEQVQQSVWMSGYDHREFLQQVISELGLTDCVQMYEAARLFPK